MPLDRKRLLKPAKKLRKLVKRVERESTPEQVHDLRTSTRQFEAIVEALGLDAKGFGKRVVRDLSRCRKRAGKVRDMDVLTSLASTMHLDGEEECATQLLEYLGAQRKKRANRLSAEVKQHRPRLRDQLKKAPALLLKRIQETSDGSRKISAPTAAATAVTLATELSAPKRLSRQNLHAYRLTVKDLRNILRMAAGNETSSFIADLGRVKDAIGEWHDWEELIMISNKVLDHGNRCALLAELKRIAECKYEDALKLTHSLRKKYAGKGYRGRKPAGRSNRVLSEPVWNAIAAMAS